MNVVKEEKREWVKRGSYIPLGEPRLWKRDESESGKLFFRCHNNDGRLSILVLCQRAFTIHTHFIDCPASEPHFKPTCQSPARTGSVLYSSGRVLCCMLVGGR